MIADQPPTGGATPVPTHWLTDRRLSFDARGLLVMIVDATRWEPFDVPGLRDRLRQWTRPEDQRQLDARLRELTGAGYLCRVGRRYRLANPEH